MNEKKLIENFLEYKRVHNRSKHNEIRATTLDLYNKVLGYFLDIEEPTIITNANDGKSRYERIEVAKSEVKPFEEKDDKDFDAFLSSVKSVRTRNNYATTIKEFYKWFYRADNKKIPWFISQHKSHAVEINEVEYQKKLVTEGEYEKLITFSSNPMQKALIECLLICGARRGRLLSLKVKDVGFEDGKTYIEVLNSKSRDRKVWHPGRAEHLLAWKETFCPNRDKPEEFLFAQTRNGQAKHVNYNYAYDTLETICERAGIRQIRPHDFRHTFITNRCKEMPESLVKQQAGLSKNSKQLEVYSHITDKDAKDFLDRNHKTDKVSYQKLEEQKKTLEEKHTKEIEELKSQMQEILSRLPILDLSKPMPHGSFEAAEPKTDPLP